MAIADELRGPWTNRIYMDPKRGKGEKDGKRRREKREEMEHEEGQNSERVSFCHDLPVHCKYAVGWVQHEKQLD